MFPAIWNFTKTPYYEFVVVKEPELIVQWREFHAYNEPVALPGVFPSRKHSGSAFHVLPGHIPYKEGVKSIVFFGLHNGINRTGPTQYYPLEDFATLIYGAHPDDEYQIPVLDENDRPVIDKNTNKPEMEIVRPIRHNYLSSNWLKDFMESRADHKVQAEPPPSGLAALLPYIPYIIVAVVLIYLVSVFTGNPIIGSH